MVCLKTFQSILNFLNCGWVISDTTCGGETGVDLVNEDVVRLCNRLGIGKVGGCSFAFKISK